MEGRLTDIARKFSQYFSSSQGTPFILTLALLAILFILFRMKSIEQDYQYNEVSSKIDREQFENKELKAKKAKLLSVENLSKMSQKFLLGPPREDQIIVID